MQTSPSHWEITIKNGVKVCVDPTIQKMTPYVLLEQEDWFEEEMDFVRALTLPDMNAFDIGANHGVYGLSIAKGLETGHVWAFEPTLAPGSMLARSIEANGFQDRVTWVHAGLSDKDGTARINISPNSELNSLHGEGGETEEIALFALDRFIGRHDIRARIDFVKLDAEGEEISIIEGGQSFFSTQSPLIMFELKHGNQVNRGLIGAISALGYNIYRLVPGLNALVEYTPDFTDGFLLNLFAAKPAKARELAARSLLIEPVEESEIPSPAQGAWLQSLDNMPFTAPFRAKWAEDEPSLPAAVDFALSAATMADGQDIPVSRRYGLLHKAFTAINHIADAGRGDVALWFIRLNLAHRLGERSLSLGIAQKLADLPGEMLEKLEAPFLLPAPEYYKRDLGPRNGGILHILKEFIEYRKAFSSYFVAPNIRELSQFITHAGHDLEIQRRLVLTARRHGAPLALPAQHQLLQPEKSANAKAWLDIAPPRAVA